MFVRQGAITDEDRLFTETWENVTAASNTIIHLDRRGEEAHEVISGRRRFMVTTEERLIFQDKVRDPKHDPFQNGCFRPVIVPGTVNVKSNPNALGDDEIVAVLTSSDLAWQEWLRTIDSPATITRMVEVADSVDTLTVKRLRELEARLKEVKPRTRVAQKDQATYEAMSTGTQPTPTKAARRTQGGRSADYR